MISASVCGGGNGAVEGWIEGIEVPGVQIILEHPKRFPEALEVYDFPFPQEPDGVCHLGILHQSEDIIVGGAGFLLWGDLVSTTYTKI